MNKLLLYVLLFISLQACKKESVEDVYITSGETNNTSITYLVPFTISYEVSGPEVESICLWVDNEIVETHKSIKSVFSHSFPEIGEYSVYMSVFYQGGKEKKTPEIIVYVVPYESPTIRIKMENANGFYESFVGDEFFIELEPEYSWYYLDTTQAVSLIINEDTVGSVIGPPYNYNSGIIDKEVNLFQVSYIDRNGITRVYEEIKELQVNPLPELEIDLYGYELGNGCFFDNKPVKIGISAKENTKISHIEFYLNDELILDEEVDYYYYSEPLILENLIPDEYMFYVIVYDDRGNFIKSDDHFFSLNHSIEIPFSDIFIEMKHTSDPSLVYAISRSNLFLINPLIDELITVKLPFDYAVSMDYTDDGQLYIASKYGKVAIWNMSTEQFELINTQVFHQVRDIEIDPSRNGMFLINLNRLYYYDFETQDTVSFNKDLSDFACLAYHVIKDVIIVGGDENSSDNIFYKVTYSQNSFGLVAQGRMSEFAKEIIINPNNNEFLIRSWRDAGHVWDLDDFANEIVYFDIRFPEAIAYNKDYTKIALGDVTNGNIYFYNGLEYLNSKEFKIGLSTYESIKLICSTQQIDKWLVFIVNHMDNEARIVFLNVN